MARCDLGIDGARQDGHLVLPVGWKNTHHKATQPNALVQANIPVEEDAPVRVYQYYPPFAPGWLRLNEVLLPVRAAETAAQ